MTRERWHRWYHRKSTWICGGFGFVAGLYFLATGDTLRWPAGIGDPIFSVYTLFDVHPLLGLGVLTAGGFAVGWLEWHVERRFGGD